MKIAILVSALVALAVATPLEQSPEIKFIEKGISGEGTTTRYWDCCKPSCSWRGNVHTPSGVPVASCDRSGVNRVDANAKSGKLNLTVPIVVTNTGSDLSHNHFDIALPGGGVGIFTQGCHDQWNAPWNGWGDQYGGVHNRGECATLPQALQSGCYFRFDFYQNANNPRMHFDQVQCPAEIVARSGCSL
uniref:Cellulase n=1 Tax=Diabrotica virgifera virgifera TaxID=50390 RepID=A0A6P7G4I7_DIAVI